MHTRNIHIVVLFSFFFSTFLRHHDYPVDVLVIRVLDVAYLCLWVTGLRLYTKGGWVHAEFGKKTKPHKNQEKQEMMFKEKNSKRNSRRGGWFQKKRERDGWDLRLGFRQIQRSNNTLSANLLGFTQCLVVQQSVCKVEHRGENTRTHTLWSRHPVELLTELWTNTLSSERTEKRNGDEMDVRSND